MYPDQVLDTIGGLIMRFENTVIVVLLVLSLGIHSTAESEETRAGDEEYIIGPLNDVTAVDEDEFYSSIYFPVMGDMTQNSLTGPDWLSMTQGLPLTLNTTGLEAIWTFDMRNADDSSGNGHHGTVTGAQPDTGVFGIGSSMTFDGDDYITIPHDDRLNITDEITVEAWIYPTFTDTGEHMILSKGANWGDDDPQDYELTMDKDRPLFQIKLPGSNDWYGAAPDEPITKETWHHVAGVYDGYIFKIYIDGINQTTLYSGWGGDYMGHIYTGGLPTSSHNISIGRRQPASWGSLFFEGNIDEVRIFDRALDDDEVLEHATRPGTPTLLVTGTPDNSDVGDHQVTISVTSSDGYSDERQFTLTVNNVLPNITTEDVASAVEDLYYSVDYDADDEGIGTTAWSLLTDASFLSIDSATGHLSGTPTNDDVGDHDVTVGFSDGNGGIDTHEFVLNVMDVNDAPSIITDSIPNATEDEVYQFTMEGDDIDGEILNWTFETTAEWINGSIEGSLSGTPENDDVGVHRITARATDPRGLFVEREFEMTVFNVNDEPFWVDIPELVTIDEGDIFRFDVNATDVDEGDTLSYSVLTFPETNLTIDEEGIITWKATRGPFEETPYNLTVKVEATDERSTIIHNFHINVTPDPSATTTLFNPSDGAILAENHTMISWSYDDTEISDFIFFVYFSDTRSDITSLNEDVFVESKGPSIDMYDLERGTTYYWTVIAWDGFSNGTCTNGIFSFYVNTPPTTDLIKPIEGSRHSASRVELSWNSFDIEEHNMTYDVYLGDSSTMMEGLVGMYHFASGIEGKDLVLTDLEPGKTYYWTVIPDDGYNFGSCTSGIWRFKTNSPPEFSPVENVTFEAGDRISIDVNATDTEDALEFSLVDPVEGMFINEDTGMFIWIPKEKQIGIFEVTVKVTDGIDETFLNFTLTITEEHGEKDVDDEFSPVLIGVIIGAVLFLVLLIVLVWIIMRRRKEEPEQAPEVPDEPQEEPVFPASNTGTSSGPLTEEVPPPVMKEDTIQQPPPGQTEVPSEQVPYEQGPPEKGPDEEEKQQPEGPGSQERSLEPPFQNEQPQPQKPQINEVNEDDNMTQML